MSENKEKKKTEEANENKEDVMSLNDHLRELRNRIIICVVFLLVGFLLCFNKAADIVSLLTSMGLEQGYAFVFLTPQELLVQYMKVGLLGAIVITFPILMYEIWAFIKPGLKQGENFFFFVAMVAGLICFVIGVAFAHLISMPFMLGFLNSLQGTEYIQASISIENYLTFVLTVYVVFGAVFEMPVVSVILTQFGLLKPKWLMKGRAVAIVVIFFVAAIITPPDIVSQVMVAIPMIFLYQLSIGLCKFFWKMKLRGDEYASDEELEEAGIKRRKTKKKKD